MTSIALPAATGPLPTSTLRLVPRPGRAHERSADADALPSRRSSSERPVLVAGSDAHRRAAVIDELAETLPHGTSFREAAAPWEVLAHARESRLVVIAGGFDELQREALLHTVANRHPGLPVVSLEPAGTPVG
jgi:hypothetical protein